MALWPILQYLLIIILAIFLFLQVVYPVWTNSPIFPIFRRKKKVEKPVKKKEEPMSAERALELVNFHCTKALHFIAMAESYAENEEKHAKESLDKALATMDNVKKRAEKIKEITPNEKEGV